MVAQADPYVGREQTKAKHFILRNYLQTLTFKLLSSAYNELTYVDGFSGPWEAQTEDYSDTSFMIALEVLKDAQRHFADKGERRIIKCFFVEKEPVPYEKLCAAVLPHHDPDNDFHVATFGGQFEDAVRDVMDFIGRSFSLVFIDPTGWTGYPYDKIAPLLKHRPGEVLVNLMFGHASRFAASQRPEIIKTFDPVLGGPGWQNELDPSLSPSAALEHRFREVLKERGEFDYVLSTKIEQPLADRPHYFICYGTRHRKGVDVFRTVEHRALKGHEKHRGLAKRRKKSEREGTGDLFAHVDMPDDYTIDLLVRDQRHSAQCWILNWLLDIGPARFDRLWAAALERFILRVTDMKDICVELAKAGKIEDAWTSTGKSKPHDAHIIRLAKGNEGE